jgi:hypothetical protein
MVSPPPERAEHRGERGAEAVEVAKERGQLVVSI